MGTIEAYLTLDTHGFSMGLNNARQDLQTFTDGTRTTGDRFSALGSAMTNVGANLTRNVTMPIIGIGTAAAKTAMDFEYQISRVSAISGAVGDDLAMLEQQAKDLGKSTQYSAVQSASAMEQLASAGFNATEIYAAMPGLLDLAATDNIELASAASIAAAALNGFGLTADQTGHVADVLAESAARTNATVSSLGNAFRYIAPVAHATGISMEETAAAVGILSDAGISGTKAGTSLRGMLSRLAKPTEKSAELMAALGFNAYDSNGKMKSLSGIIDNLQTSMSGLTEQEKQNALVTMFGKKSLPTKVERLCA